MKNDNFSPIFIKHAFCSFNTVLPKSNININFVDIYGYSKNINDIQVKGEANCYGCFALYLILALSGHENLYFKCLQKIKTDANNLLETWSNQGNYNKLITNQIITISQDLFFLDTIAQLQQIQAILSRKDGLRFLKIKKINGWIEKRMSLICIILWIAADLSLFFTKSKYGHIQWLSDNNSLDYILAGIFLLFVMTSVFLVDKLSKLQHKNELIKEEKSQIYEKERNKIKIIFRMLVIVTFLYLLNAYILANVNATPKYVQWLNYILAGMTLLLSIISLVLRIKAEFFIDRNNEVIENNDSINKQENQGVLYYSVCFRSTLHLRWNPIEPGHQMAAKYDPDKKEKWTLFDYNLASNQADFESKESLIEGIKQTYKVSEKIIVFTRCTLSENVQSNIDSLKDSNDNGGGTHNYVGQAQEILHKFFNTPNLQPLNQENTQVVRP